MHRFYLVIRNLTGAVTLQLAYDHLSMHSLLNASPKLAK